MSETQSSLLLKKQLAGESTTMKSCRLDSGGGGEIDSRAAPVVGTFFRNHPVKIVSHPILLRTASCDCFQHIPSLCPALLIAHSTSGCISELNKNPVEGFSAGLIDENDIHRWEVLIIGPPDTL